MTTPQKPREPPKVKTVQPMPRGLEHTLLYQQSGRSPDS